MFTPEETQEYQKKYGLTYHVFYTSICQDLVGFKNKDVLEVGGSLPPEFVFDILEVKSWTGVETPDYEKSLKDAGGLIHNGTIIQKFDNTSNLRFDNKQNNRYNFYLDGIENLPENYYEQYDLIFSIAAFEHIHKMYESLEKMFCALRPGGKLFSIFCPIWSSYDGHHLPIIQDSQGQEYSFVNPPIPPWGHLLFTRAQMTYHLYQTIDKKTADKIVYYIYQSDHINRYFTEDYLDAIELSLFKINELQLMFEAEIDDYTKKKLQLIYPRNNNFTNNGLQIVLEKEDFSYLNLSEVNLIIFPDWSAESEEEAILEIIQIIYNLLQENPAGCLTLLIEGSYLPVIELEIVSQIIVMNFVSHFALDLPTHFKIQLVPNLNLKQWKNILPKIQGRIKMKWENETIIKQEYFKNLKLIRSND